MKNKYLVPQIEVYYLAKPLCQTITQSNASGSRKSQEYDETSSSMSLGWEEDDETETK